MRIASLIPSGTDIACELGLTSNLVGISHCCDNPSTTHLPILTRSIVDSTLPPSQIDADVSSAVQAGESLYITKRELLSDLRPDIVLTQTICDVCAVNSQTAARDLPQGAHLVNLSATSFEGLWGDMRNVATATQNHETQTRAEALIAEMQARLDAVRSQVQSKNRRGSGTPRVLVLEWSDPAFLGGHWVPEMVEIAGGVHLLSGPNEPSRRASWDEIRASEPEVILLAPCGYDLEETIAQGRELLSGPLGEVHAREIWATNATALFSRCTPATVRGVEVVAGILHPDTMKAPCPSEAVRLLKP